MPAVKKGCEARDLLFSNLNIPDFTALIFIAFLNIIFLNRDTLVQESILLF